MSTAVWSSSQPSHMIAARSCPASSLRLSQMSHRRSRRSCSGTTPDETDRQTQTEGQTDETEGRTDRRTDRQTDQHSDRQTLSIDRQWEKQQTCHNKHGFDGVCVTVAYIQTLVKLCLGLLVISHVLGDAVIVLLPLGHKLLLQVGPSEVLLKLLSASVTRQELELLLSVHTAHNPHTVWQTAGRGEGSGNRGEISCRSLAPPMSLIRTSCPNEVVNR